jgi:hypothetical protein
MPSEDHMTTKPTKAVKPTKADKHAVDGAVYALTGPGPYEPTLLCACGKQFSGYNWEEAGADYDSHLAARGERQ